MINIIYAALPMHAQTEKTTFSCKDDCTLTKHTQRCTYSARDFEIPLCHTPPLRSFFFKTKYFFCLIGLFIISKLPIGEPKYANYVVNS